MLCNTKNMLLNAFNNKYAICQFNINNLEWAKYILEECEKNLSPVILGVSESAVKYMGGYNTVSMMITGMMLDLNITIPVALHLDHGSSVESCKEAIDMGFSSVMIDASKYELEENIRITKEVVDYAHPRGISVEAEVGHIGGTEDNIYGNIDNATLEDCEILYKNTNIDSLAPALGSVHGFYKKEANLDFVTMKQISDALPIPLVLHGGTGIPEDMIKKAISLGVAKINVNTECQLAFADATRKYIEAGKDLEGKGFDPRKLLAPGAEAIKATVKENMKLFSSINKA